MCELFTLENIYPLDIDISIDYKRKIAQGTVSCSAWADIGPAAAFSGGVRVAGALAALRPAAVTLHRVDLCTKHYLQLMCAKLEFL